MLSSFIASPLLLLWIPYGIFLFFFVLYSLFSLYHLWRFGVGTGWIGTITILYVLLTGFILTVSVLRLLSFDWSVGFEIDSLIPNPSDSPFRL